MRQGTPARARALRGVAVLVAAALLNAAAAHGGDAAAAEIVLAPGPPIRGVIAAGETKRFRLDLEADDYVRATVEQHGVDVSVVLWGPDGQAALDRNREPIRTLPERFSFVAAEAGPYVLEVRASPGEPSGRYAVRYSRMRPAGVNERVLAAADAGKQAPARLTELRDEFRGRGDRRGEATALCQLGRLEASGDDDRARATLEEALSIFRAVGDATGAAMALSDLGDLSWRRQHDMAAARRAYEEALTILEAGHDTWHAALMLDKIGGVSLVEGHPEPALDFFARARSAYVQEEDVREEVGVVMRMSRALAVLGDFERALAMAREARTLASEAGLEHLRDPLQVSVGDLQRAAGDLDGAEKTFVQALHTMSGTRDGDSWAIAQLRLAGLWLERSDPQGALRRAALFAGREVGRYARATRQRGFEAESDILVGRALRRLGRLDEAAASLRHALALREEPHQRVALTEVLVELALVERDQGQLDEALAHVERAVGLVEGLRDEVTDPDWRASLLAGHSDLYAIQADILMRLHRRAPGKGHDAAALQVSERARARVLLEALGAAGVDVREGIEPGLLERERAARSELRAASDRLGRTAADPGAADQVAAAEAVFSRRAEALRQVESLVRKASPRYSALTQPLPATLQEIRSEVLDDETLLLEFMLGPERGYVWAVTATELVSAPLPPAAIIEGAARRTVGLMTARQRGGSPAALARADAQLATASARLSRLLLAPLSPRLSGAWKGRRLLIVPSGALAYVPFGALPVPGRPGPRLADTHEIVYAPSASVVLALRREPAAGAPAPAQVAVIADPVFEASDPRVRKGLEARAAPAPSPAASPAPALPPPVLRAARALGRTAFARLPFTRREALAIAAETPADALLVATDFAASREWVTGGAVDRARIVHFATHGIMETANPSLSGLVLSLVDQQGRAQDGFLRLPEIYNLRLQADLVVLSGCQTALGREIRAEGLVGLTRGFLYAGARGVVASLWEVDDESTSELMKRFYRALLSEGRSPAEALRTAQAGMAREARWAAPFYWAGFVLQGEWRRRPEAGGTFRQPSTLSFERRER